MVDVRRRANGPAAGGACARLLHLPKQCQATCPSWAPSGSGSSGSGGGSSACAVRRPA
jgi:hypothetical protein